MGFFSWSKQRPPSGRPHVVKRETRSLSDERGWKRNPTDTGWVGVFHTRYGQYHGAIYKRGDIWVPYIKSPPACLARHPKWICFIHDAANPGWWRVHLATQPHDGTPSSLIHYVEKLIVEAFKL